MVCPVILVSSILHTGFLSTSYPSIPHLSTSFVLGSVFIGRVIRMLYRRIPVSHPELILIFINEHLKESFSAP